MEALLLLVCSTFTVTLSQKTKIVSNVMYLYIHPIINDGISDIQMDKNIVYITQTVVTVSQNINKSLKCIV